MEAAKSSYDNRFGGGVSIGRMPVLNTYSGTVRWADSNGGSNGDGSFKRPYASVDAANNVCAAGDLIMVKAGHTETLTTSNKVTQDVAGVAVVGVGVGNRRPTFTFTPSAVGDNSWAMSAANCAVVNIIGKPGLDAITNPFNVSAAGCTLDIEWQDASAAIEAETVILTTAAADSLKINLTYRGFTAGNACVAPIKLVGCTDGRINVDFHGVASTAIVNFITTLSTDIFVTGYVFNSGTTDGSKLVVDTIGSSTWFADIQDGAAGSRFTGGSAVAINDVIGTVATAAASGAVTTTDKLMAYIKQLVTELQVVDEFHDVPAADNVLNAQINEVIGNKTDAAATGAVTTTDTLVGYIKQLVTELAVVDEFHDVPAADATANAQVNEVVGNKTDASVYVPGTTKSLAAYAKGTANLQENVATTAAAVIAAGTATIFTIAGGPIEVLELLSVCVTANDATATLLKYTADPTDGAATDVSIASASLANATAGTTALVTGTFGAAPTISANGTVAAGTTKFIVPAGVLQTITTGGATTGTWTHHLRYKPIAKGVTVS